MPIQNIHTFLVYPNKGIEEPVAASGTAVPLEGKVYELLRGVYGAGEDDHPIDISFNHDAAGDANNACRTLICDYIRQPSVETGRAIATRLGSFTTKRSGLGLLFLAQGYEGLQPRVVIARFPANNGILAEQGDQALTVQFLERVFMRSAFAYKAVAFQDTSIDKEFWTGKAIDRQINSGELEVSRYWINDFLDSDFRTTSAAGTKRLAKAMRDAARKTPDLPVKQEIVAAVTLAQGVNGQTMNTEQFMERFGLSPAAREAIVREMPYRNLIQEQFRFDAPEFARQVPFRSVQLDSGAILTADARKFDEVFEHEDVPDGVRYFTTGKVVSDKLEKVR